MTDSSPVARVVDEIMSSGLLPGLSVLVARNGVVVEHKPCHLCQDVRSITEYDPILVCQPSGLTRGGLSA